MHQRKVEVEIEESDEGTLATCGDCNHMVECPQTGHAGVAHCLAALGRTCPLKEDNRYIPAA